MIFPKYDKEGNMVTNDSYKEIFKLKKMLEDACIPFEFERNLDGWQVFYPAKYPNCICDAIEHFGSYGHEDDLLEIMGLLNEDEEAFDSVAGWLSAENVFGRMKEHYERREQ